MQELGYPRALFDPHYIPPKLLHRKKELKILGNLFRDSLNPDEQFNLNVYLYGIPGIGKTVLTKYLLNLLKADLEQKFISLYLDLAVKSPSENLRLLVEIYAHSHSTKFTYIKSMTKLWSYFHYLRNKTNLPLLLILENIDPLNQQLYEKIVRFSRPLKLCTIATSQIPLSLYTQNSKWLVEQLEPLKLEMYSPSALLDILSQRINLAFPIELDYSLSKYIVDIVTQFDQFRPSTCINILKSIYQHLLSGKDINPTLIRDESVHLLEFPYPDDLNCLIEFDNSSIDLFYLPLLEKIAIYFLNAERIYIDQAELFRLYKITCDELLLPYNPEKFHQFFNHLLSEGFLYPSQFKSENKNAYYMLLDPKRLVEYLEIKASDKLP